MGVSSLTIRSFEGSTIALTIRSFEGSTIALTIRSFDRNGISIALAIRSLEGFLSQDLLWDVLSRSLHTPLIPRYLLA